MDRREHSSDAPQLRQQADRRNKALVTSPSTSGATIVYSWSLRHRLGYFVIVVAWVIGWPVVAVGGAPPGSTELWVGIAGAIIGTGGMLVYGIACPAAWRISVCSDVFIFDLFPFGHVAVPAEGIKGLAPVFFYRSLAKGAVVTLVSGRQIRLISKMCGYERACRVIREAIQLGRITPGATTTTPQEQMQDELLEIKRATITRNGLIIFAVSIVMLLWFVAVHW